MPEEVPTAKLYYAKAENNCSEVLKLADHPASVSCALNLSSGRLEDDVNPDDSISQTTRSTKKSSSTTASSVRLKACGLKSGVDGACTGRERRSGAQTKTVTIAI